MCTTQYLVDSAALVSRRLTATVHDGTAVISSLVAP